MESVKMSFLTVRFCFFIVDLGWADPNCRQTGKRFQLFIL